MTASHLKSFHSGHASICSEGRLLLIENLSKGIDLYDLPRSAPACTFPVPTKKRYTKDCIFAEGTHGLVYIFSIDHSEPVQILKQCGMSTLVQTLDVSVLQLAMDLH